MPMGTAVWLIDNTSLSFHQIAEFLGIHDLEIKAIADGEVATSIRGVDPISERLLTREEISRCESDPDAQLQSQQSPDLAEDKRRKQNYTPISRRADKPDAIAWLQRHHPELSESQISRLIGTTRLMIRSIANRTHWNIANIRARSPVELGLCKASSLNTAVEEARTRRGTTLEHSPEPQPAQPEPHPISIADSPSNDPTTDPPATDDDISQGSSPVNPFANQ